MPGGSNLVSLWQHEFFRCTSMHPDIIPALAHTSRFAECLWRPLASPTTHASTAKSHARFRSIPAREMILQASAAYQNTERRCRPWHSARSSAGSDGEEKFPLPADDRKKFSDVPEMNREATDPNVGDRPVRLTNHV
jgi:hypothetical protein